MIKIFKKALGISFLVLLGLMMPAKAEISSKIITKEDVKDILAFANTDIVMLSVENQNRKLGTMDQERIDKLDQQWRTETKSDLQPLIAATLTNPLSSYLTRVQAHSRGLYTEIFVMDFHGLNVGQSNITSDMWQGDEAKFQKTFSKGVNAIFIDDAEYNHNIGAWVAQVSFSLTNAANVLVGAMTVEVNLTELSRRKQLGL